MGDVRVLHGDSREVLKTLPDNSVDSVVTDPPYALVSIVKRFGKAGAAPAKGNAAFTRASAGFMGQQWDTGETVESAEFWAEVYRVLKPGGHVLAFSGTRTQHRQTCAIEDAGFEIRDMITDLIASDTFACAFMDSLDEEQLRAFVRAIDESQFGGMLGWVFGSGFPKSHDVGKKLEEWQGWGTALKPALEPICVARKPLGIPATNVLAVVESQLRVRGVTGEIQWIRGPAKNAEKSRSLAISGSTEPPQMAETSAKTASAPETPRTVNVIETHIAPQGVDGDLTTSNALGKNASAGTGSCESKSSLHMAPTVDAAGKASPSSSPSTTLREGEARTEKRSTERSTLNCDAKDFRPDIESFVGIATGLTDSLAHVLIKRNADGLFVWPNHLPEHVPARPLTVAANVLEYGTGALNIDASRVEGGTGGGRDGEASAERRYDDRGSTDFAPTPGPRGGDAKGRWPANVLHDGSDEVVAAFPETTPGMPSGRPAEAYTTNGKNAVYGEGMGGGYHAGFADSSGSAARFFYTAKADSIERLGSKHPTVKPIDLMAYLVRLVTPPGGTVLDPFAGSGTTGVAAVFEGFNAILIEREAAYVADIERRIAWARGQGGLTKSEIKQPPPERMGGLFEGLE